MLKKVIVDQNKYSFFYVILFDTNHFRFLIEKKILLIGPDGNGAESPFGPGGPRGPLGPDGPTGPTLPLGPSVPYDPFSLVILIIELIIIDLIASLVSNKDSVTLTENILKRDSFLK